MELKEKQAKALDVRCVECKAYAYHDPEMFTAVNAGDDVDPEYHCPTCTQARKGFSCCDERERLKQRVKDLEAIVMRFASDAAGNK